MSLYPYGMLLDNQDEITLAHLTSSMGTNDGTWYMPNAGWLTSFANYGFITTGRRLHGDNQPRAFVNTLTNRGTDPAVTSVTLPGGPASLWYNPALTNYWNLINCWAVIVGEESNTCTNAYTAVYDIQLYTLLASTGRWTRVDSRDGRPAFAFSWYPTTAWNSAVAGTNYYDDYGHTGWTNTYLGAFKNLHNAFMPMQTVDASDVIACMATCKARLFNPTGAAFDATPKIMISVGMDNKYNTDSLGSGVLSGATYLPGLGGSASKLLPEDGSPIRVTFSTMRATNTVVGGSTDSVWTDNPANIPYLSESEMSNNLPVLRLNAPL